MTILKMQLEAPAVTAARLATFAVALGATLANVGARIVTFTSGKVIGNGADTGTELPTRTEATTGRSTETILKLQLEAHAVTFARLITFAVDIAAALASVGAHIVAFTSGKVSGNGSEADTALQTSAEAKTGS